MQTHTNLVKPQKKIKSSAEQNALDEQYRPSNDVQIIAVQSEQITVLENEQIIRLSAQQVTLLSATQMSVLSEEQISSLTEDQITGKQYIGDYWTPEISLNESGISNNSRGLSAAQIIAMGDKVLYLGTIAITNLTTEATQALAPQYIAQFTAGQIRGLNTSVLHTSQIAAISAQGIVGLTSTQLINIGKRISSVSIDAIQALTPEQITVLTVAQVIMLSASQIRAFKKIQIAALSKEQVASFSTMQIKALFKDSALSPQYLSICISMCFDFNTNHLSKQQIIELGDNVQFLSANLIANLSREATQAIQAKYIAEFTKEQISALNTKALCADQIAAISAYAIAGLSPKQLRQMGTEISNLSDEAIKALSNEQLCALSEEQTNILAQNNASAFSILLTTQTAANNALQNNTPTAANNALPNNNTPTAANNGLPDNNTPNPAPLPSQHLTINDFINRIINSITLSDNSVHAAEVNFVSGSSFLDHIQLSSLIQEVHAQFILAEANNQNPATNDALENVTLMKKIINTIEDQAISTTTNTFLPEQDLSTQNQEANTDPITLTAALINIMASMDVGSSAETTPENLFIQHSNFLAAIIIRQANLNSPSQ